MSNTVSKRIRLVTRRARPCEEAGDHDSPLLDTHQRDNVAVMKDSLETEGKALALYKELLTLVAGRSVMLEEYAQQMIYAEELHAGEIDKMLRRLGEIAAFTGTTLSE